MILTPHFLIKKLDCQLPKFKRPLWSTNHYGLTPDYLGAKYIDRGTITHCDTESKLTIPLPRARTL